MSLPPESFRIVSVEPEDSAEQISIQTSLKVVFNSEIDQEAVYPGSILLLQNSTFIQGNHEVNGKSLIFQPQDNLSHSTTYQWSVVSGIRNLNGQMLETTNRMTFKTEDYVDRIPPRLLLVTPQNNASGVATDSSIELTFSDPILSESLNAENFSLLDANGQSVPGVFNSSGSDAVFTPSAALDHFRDYRIQIGTGI
ncbi:MAG: Ig-like domain-containing protein, partial [SAR324 cluster bacterium]|nr:Ig-like domain-containing protein [SAR324 cluster bacterium]